MFHLKTLETKSFPDWKSLWIMPCYFHQASKYMLKVEQAQLAFTCSKSTIIALEKGVKYVQI